jgi:hypothetical protein
MEEDIDKVASDLMYEAHNNQMIDSHFTAIGETMVRAATMLRMLALREEKLLETLCDIEDRVSRILKHG